MNFIRSIFRTRYNSYNLVKVNQLNLNYNIDDIKTRLNIIDKEIKSASQEIFKAQVVRVRSMLTRETNIIGGFKKQIVESKASTSAEWHQKKVVALHQERVSLQIKLDQLTGRTWQRRINRLIRIISLVITFLLSFLIVTMVIFASFYLFPFFLIFLICFISINKLKNRL